MITHFITCNAMEAKFSTSFERITELSIMGTNCDQKIVLRDKIYIYIEILYHKKI